MEQPIETPSSRWHANGEKDPHAGHYDKERAALCLGQYTDDEIANGAYLNYDQPLNMRKLLADEEGYHTPIVWMQAVKDRIRWLSRALQKSEAECLELRKRLAQYENKE